MRRCLLALPLICYALPAIAAPTPGAVKMFKDWAAGCDNGKRCTIASQADPRDMDTGASLMLERDAGPAGEMRIRLHLIDGESKALSLAIDGRRMAGSGTIMLADASALANSSRITITPAGAAPLAISPQGIAAALRYVDAMQGRTGTVSAVVAKGPKPAATVPVAPALPLITAVKASGSAAMPNKQQVAALARSAKCDPSPDVPQDASSFALSPGRALVLIPCSSGAYNLWSAVFIITDGKPRPASFDASTSFGEARIVPNVDNARYKGGVLTTRIKARGMGDCGNAQSFVWDGTQFRLSEQSEMGECRGNPNFITTWRARVVRP